MKRSWQISRRTVLRGGGAAIALPFLEEMIPPGKAARAAGKVAPRFVGLFMPNGTHTDVWEANVTKTLAPIREHTILPINLRQGDKQCICGHESGTRAFLTSHNSPVPGKATSLDQVIGEHYKGQTRIHSLQLGHGFTGDSQERSISYSNGTRLVTTTRASDAFKAIFTGDKPSVSILQDRKVVVDYVLEDVAKLRRQSLGAASSHKLDEFLTGVSELQRIIQHTETAAPGTCSAGAAPAPEDGTSKGREIRVFLDLIVKAFECDLTRSATFMFGRAVGDNTYPEVTGTKESHHSTLSHNEGDSGKIARWVKLDQWFVGHTIYLAQELKKRMAPDGQTLLHHAVLFFSSDVNDGKHAQDRMPAFLIGHAGGAFRGGQTLRYPKDGGPTFGDLFLSILGAFGIERTTFGLWGKKPLLG